MMMADRWDVLHPHAGVLDLAKRSARVTNTRPEWRQLAAAPDHSGTVEAALHSGARIVGREPLRRGAILPNRP